MKKRFSDLSLLNKMILIAVPLLYFAVFIILRQTYGNELLEIVESKEKFDAFISSFGVRGEIVFVTIRAVQTVVKIIPAEPLEIAAGYVWGTYKGLALCMLGTEIGSAIILILTSLFGIKLINMLFDVRKINEWSFISDSKRKYALLTIIYLIPGTPKDFITYFVGVTDTKILPFLVLTGIARIPSIISSTWCGSILDNNSIPLFVIVFVFITILSAMATYLFMKRLKTQIRRT